MKPFAIAIFSVLALGLPVLAADVIPQARDLRADTLDGHGGADDASLKPLEQMAADVLKRWRETK